MKKWAWLLVLGLIVICLSGSAKHSDVECGNGDVLHDDIASIVQIDINIVHEWQYPKTVNKKTLQNQGNIRDMLFMQYNADVNSNNPYNVYPNVLSEATINILLPHPTIEKLQDEIDELVPSL